MFYKIIKVLTHVINIDFSVRSLYGKAFTRTCVNGKAFAATTVLQSPSSLKNCLCFHMFILIIFGPIDTSVLNILVGGFSSFQQLSVM